MRPMWACPTPPPTGNRGTSRLRQNEAIIGLDFSSLQRESMDKAPGVLVANQIVRRPGPAPRLRLLIEREPGHRVFFGNLADLLLSRRVPQVALTSRPARFWNDVFVPSGAPWSSFMESMLLHLLLVVLIVWGQSRVWVSVELFPQRDAIHKSITYYPPTQTFPAVGSRAPRVRVGTRVKQASAHTPARPPAMPVTREQKPGIVTPPDIKQATARVPNLPGSHAVTPMVPFAATASPRPGALAGPSGVVGPPPEVLQGTARRLALPQASAIAPAPELGAASAGRAMKAPDAGGVRVVPPPPSDQNAANSARAGRLSSGLNSGLSPLSGAGPNVVPPPPSVQGAGNAGADARLGSMASAHSQAVPPPPSFQGARNSAGNGRIVSDRLSPTGLQAVPPPPSLQGSAGTAGGKRLGALSGAGSEVVPPAPSIESAAKSGGRPGSLSANGSPIVPPPPSIEGGGRRLGSLSGNGVADGSAVMPPPTAMEGAGNSGASGTGKVLEPMDPLPADPSSPSADANNDPKSTVEELPLGLLGVVFAAPGTSYFSNFEVFVAKRRVGKDLQLIKLVYEFLPYQRRLSEYDLNNSSPRVIKLRVTPDPSCDEPLGQVIQPRTDPNLPAPEYPKLPEALRSSDLNAVLPCYRTTAADFQKAMSRKH